jgi:hypothetical protein
LFNIEHKANFALLFVEKFVAAEQRCDFGISLKKPGFPKNLVSQD